MAFLEGVSLHQGWLLRGVLPYVDMSLDRHGLKRRKFLSKRQGPIAIQRFHSTLYLIQVESLALIRVNIREHPVGMSGLTARSKICPSFLTLG